MKRRYSAARRQLEFDTIVHHVRKNKERFIQRLVRNTRYEGGCIVWGSDLNTNGSGYPNVNFRFNGKHVTMQTHRLFVILLIARPIAKGFEAGHTCGNRRCVRHVLEQPYKENAGGRANPQ